MIERLISFPGVGERGISEVILHCLVDSGMVNL